METIAIAIEGRKAVVTLKNPPLNIMTIRMMEELATAVEDIRRSNAKVLLFKGDGKCFSAGADVREHMPDQVGHMMKSLHNLFTGIWNLEIPVVAAVHGSALGGGLELALCADMIYASQSAKLGQPEILLGVMAPYAAVLLPLEIGMKRANELLLTGRIISADEAYRAGLVTALFGDQEFQQKADEIASAITALSLPALKLCKKTVRRLHAAKVAEQVDEAERIYMNELMRGEDAEEGLKAFVEKRKPRWKDR